MNKGRRTSLKKATHLLDQAIDIVRDAKDDEQESLQQDPTVRYILSGV